MSETHIDKLSVDEKVRLIERMLLEGRLPEHVAQEMLDTVARQRHASFVAPRTNTEKKLVELLGLIKQEPTGVYDPMSTMDKGFDAELFLQKIQQEFSLKPGDYAVDNSPTLAALATDIDEQLHITTSRPEVEKASSDFQHPPLSPFQRRLWFFHHLEGPTATFNLSLTLSLEGFLDVAAIDIAARRIYERHSVLRTVFPGEDGRPQQVTLEAGHLEFHLLDVSGVESSSEVGEELSLKHGRAPFNPTTGPLCRLSLVRVSPATHLLLLCQHRMIADEESARLFMRELAQIYNQQVSGKPGKDNLVTIQYADFARWQWQHAETTWENQGLYWQKKLAGAPVRHQLPTDRPRPSMQRFKGSRQDFRFSEKLTADLLEIGAAEGASLFLVLQAGFIMFISRYSQSDDLMLGTSVSGRESNSQIAKMLGPCINNLVIRTFFESDAHFLDLLHQVRLSNLEARDNSDMPFERVVELVQPERDLAHAPLFQLFFELQKKQPKPQFSHLSTHSHMDDNGIAYYDLSLVMRPEGRGLQGYLEYNSDLFDEATTARMVRHFKIMLRSLAKRPNSRIHQLTLLSRDEREMILVDWNTTAINMGSRLCVHDLFQKQVARTPEAIALQGAYTSNPQFTYQRLNQLVNQLAHHLMEKGIRPEVTVGLCCFRSPAMVIGLLAVLKAGGAYLPLDPDYPEKRLTFMLADASVDIILMSSSLQALFPKYEGTRILLDEQGVSSMRRSIQTNPVGTVRDYHRACMIYTSGSEGRPKGVITTHRSLVNRLRWANEVFPMKPDDRFLHIATFSFDIALWEITAPLISGAQLFLAIPKIAQNLSDLLEVVLKYQITVMHFIPSLLHAFLQKQEASKVQSLKRVFCGGERLSLATVSAFFNKLSARLVHFYGPSEAAINVTAAWCRADQQAVTIGRPIANTATYVLDKHMQPIPPGVPGELYLAGACLARGYEGHAARTAASFVPNPYGGEHPFAGGGSRLYRTGDLAYLGARGNIYFMGRRDRQMQMHGFRIELGEIERTLGTIKGVSQAAVVCHELREGNQRLVGYVSALEGSGITNIFLREKLNKLLPEYMVPSVIAVLQELPLLSNGKVDRDALPQPELDWFGSGESYVAPRSREEHVLAGIWANILGMERVGIHDNFFQMSGDSMLIIQMEALAAQAGIQISARQLFEKPTIASLVSALGEVSELVVPCKLMLHELITQQALAKGDAAAIFFEGDAEFVSYEQMESMANQLAWRLVKMGIQPGKRVAICCEHGIKTVVAVLAAWKCGASCLSLDPSLEESDHILNLLDPSVVLMDSSQHLTEVQVPLLLVNVTGDAGANTHILPKSNEPELLVYQQGPAHGERLVALSHQCIIRSWLSLASVPGIEDGDAFLLLNHHNTAWSFLPLLVGARLLLTQSQTRTDIVALNRFLKKVHATICLLEAEELGLFCGALRPGKGTLKLLLNGEISVKDARVLTQRYRQVWHLFGHVETGFCCSRGLVDQRALEDICAFLGVSGPIHGAWLYVLDPDLKTVRPGTFGELYVGGHLLAQGYMNAPAQTAAHFLPDPYARDPQCSRLFKTCRRAFYLADGRFFFP